jgi:hypothetical protein
MAYWAKGNPKMLRILEAALTIVAGAKAGEYLLPEQMPTTRLTRAPLQKIAARPGGQNA